MLWCFSLYNDCNKRRSVFGPALSHAISEFDDRKTCFTCNIIFLVHFLPFFQESALNTLLYYICMILCYSPVFITAITYAILPMQNSVVARNFATTVTFMNSAILASHSYFMSSQIYFREQCCAHEEFTDCAQYINF